MKTWKILFYFLSIIPWPFMMAILAFYFHAAKVLGRLPSYNQPDPKELSIYDSYSPFVPAMARGSAS